MAERRMFAKTIIDSDAFLDMPLSTQALYFHLSMRADDDGFINNPKKLARMLGSSDDEFKVLLAKKFIIGFESGVIVIKHWKIHNYIQKDRYKKTNYADEMALLNTNEINGYTLDTSCIQDVDTGKDREELELGKSKDKMMKLRDEVVIKLSEYKNVNKEAFKEWWSYKKYKNISPITKVLNMLNNFSVEDQQKMVDNSIMNGWAGLFELKQNNQPKSFKQQEQEQNREQINKALDYNVFDLIEERARQQSQQVVIDG